MKNPLAARPSFGTLEVAIQSVLKPYIYMAIRVS